MHAAPISSHNGNNLAHTLTDAPTERPFVVRLHKRGEDRAGSFVPAASVEITPFFRTSGLLHSLPAEELKSLLFVLTFVTPNGDIVPTLHELAQAMHLSPGKADARLRRLSAFRWQEGPLLHLLRRESGLHAWSPSAHLIALHHAPSHGVEEPTLRSAHRDTVIAFSRQQYARPREEVEAEIACANGWAYPFLSRAEVYQSQTQEEGKDEKGLVDAQEKSQDRDPHAPGLRNRLLSLGVKSEQVEMLLAQYKPERIERQIAWLPARNARNPAAFLLSAIEKDYASPRGSLTGNDRAHLL